MPKENSTGTNLGDVVPNFTADTTDGTITFHDWLGDKDWALLFSHPADFTPVCTTELRTANELASKFKEKGVHMIALSCNDVESHKAWVPDILHKSKEEKMNFPIICDQTRDVAVLFNMIDPEEKDSKGLPLTCRAVFVIGPGRKVKLSMLYPATTGRNFDEIYRVILSLQVTANKNLATPANWQSGNECIIHASVKNEDLDKLFPGKYRIEDLPSKKTYLRYTSEPSPVTNTK